LTHASTSCRAAHPQLLGALYQELKRKAVTLQLLWEEYGKAHGQSAYRYSQFCRHYHEYRVRPARSMRQVHRAG
jgi:transposase